MAVLLQGETMPDAQKTILTLEGKEVEIACRMTNTRGVRQCIVFLPDGSMAFVSESKLKNGKTRK